MHIIVNSKIVFKTTINKLKKYFLDRTIFIGIHNENRLLANVFFKGKDTHLSAHKLLFP